MARGLCCAGKRREGAACLARIWKLSSVWGVVATGYIVLSLLMPPKAIERILRFLRRSLGAKNAVPEGPVTGM
jgi:hypothetical protein